MFKQLAEIETIVPVLNATDARIVSFFEVAQHHWQSVRDDLLGLPGLDQLPFTSGEFEMVLLVRVPDIAAAGVEPAEEAS